MTEQDREDLAQRVRERSTWMRLLSFGQSLASYLYQIVQFLTFNSEVRPFPFDADWPRGAP